MFPPRPALPALAASAAALALLLAGCSSSDGGNSSGSGDSGKEPAIGTVPTLLASRDLAFPLDPYIPDPRQRGLLDQAQDVLVDQCMQRYGFRYPLRRQADPAAKKDNARRYGVSDAAEAERIGYENPAAKAAQRQPQPPLGPNEKLVLHGLDVDPSKPVPMSQEEAEKSDVATTVVGGQRVPAGGCLRESALKLYAPSKDTVDLMVPQNFGFEAFARSREDSRVRTATTSWSECMAKHGYAMNSPVDQPPGIDDANISSPQAIAIAKQDVDCKKQTNLVGTWYTVEVAYQKRLAEQNAETLDRVKKQLDERLRLAASLTTAG
ncbi:hypothetical protein [Streptomyces sp. ISL-94]|uniref:hypothetical protein n=1 Tax=Streptomyces sp. ISL-94 TaxID=2819190 RepID=UPI001BE71926|nr:hypothetical protein [Streptomyces sp. ISL-94]MBT2476702.1 hypothetical protein [Streptomyces sp. ISL-94]